MMSNPNLIDKQKERDKEIDEWLLEIEKLYARDGKTNEFNKEKVCLKAYLIKLKEEATSPGKLSICKLDKPYKRGGTGIVFKASHVRIPQELVLKFNRPRKEEDTRNLIENELSILPLLEHSNIIKVIDVGKFEFRADQETCPPLCVIIESFIPQAVNLHEYVQAMSYSGIEITEQNVYLLDKSLINLTSVLKQWVEALMYIHKSGFVYLDIKPDNTIVDKDGHLMMVDFGTCQKVDREDQSSTEIFFSFPYAHPRIKKIAERTSTNRVRAARKRSEITFELDYYALGKSILELLEIISMYHSHDFPQRPLFQSLHFLATRLLDGQNGKIYRKSINWIDEKVKLDEVFDGLIAEDYATIKYEDLQDVLKDLEKELGNWDPEHVVPELETFPSTTLREVPDINTALTKRLISLIEHPLFARLKMINQLGLVTLIYPTADHTRYDHSIGVSTYTACYIKALFNDSQNCMFRNLINENDIKAAILASLLHDLGQYPFAHDLQEVQPKIFDHSSISIDFLEDDTKDRQGRTLRDIIQNSEYGWGVELDSLKRILQAHSGQVRLLKVQTVQDFKADMLSALIDGPIDADKADYIIRDSIGCRITYGSQLDIQRLLSVLTTVRIPVHFDQSHRVTIGIYEKGAASASAFSLARYLLHASVYWHHASRILKAMLQYGTVLILPDELFDAYPNEPRITEIRGKLLQFIKSSMIPPSDQLPKESKPRTFKEKGKKPIAAEPSSDVLAGLLVSKREDHSGWYPGLCWTNWLMLNWLKEMTTNEQGMQGSALIDLILQRRLYKRVYTIHYDDRISETPGLIQKFEALTWPERVRVCKSIQTLVYQTIRTKEGTVSTMLNPPQDKVEDIFVNNLVILVDIPNYKRFVPDRPLIYLPELQSKTYYRENPAESHYLATALNALMKSISPVRVLCHPDVRQWIGACISPEEMKNIVNTVISQMR